MDHERAQRALVAAALGCIVFSLIVAVLVNWRDALDGVGEVVLTCFAICFVLLAACCAANAMDAFIRWRGKTPRHVLVDRDDQSVWVIGTEADLEEWRREVGDDAA